MFKVGVIGSGNRLTPLVFMLCENEDFEVTAVCDTDTEGIKEKYKDYNVNFYIDAEEMLQSEPIDCVMIGTRCSSHTKFMEIAARYNLPTFLEKPVCTTEAQLATLESLKEIDDKVVVSFPLRNSPIVNRVREIIKSGTIGSVAHVQAFNDVNYARGYYHKWYRDENETGGLWLQKATHDFDYINSLVDGNPIQIAATNSKQIFKGDMPEGLKCTDCPKRIDCPESDINVKSYGDPYIIGEYCCFAKDTGNEDSGSAIVLYDDGMHVVYSQNFIARKSAGRRGARLIGYLGTVEFNFNTGEIVVHHHNKNLVERETLSESGGHSGGDAVLIKNFANVVRGIEKSDAPLSSGILSAKMCLMAKKSSKEKIFCKL